MGRRTAALAPANAPLRSGTHDRYPSLRLGCYGTGCPLRKIAISRYFSRADDGPRTRDLRLGNWRIDTRLSLFAGGFVRLFRLSSGHICRFGDTPGQDPHAPSDHRRPLARRGGDPRSPRSRWSSMSYPASVHGLPHSDIGAVPRAVDSPHAARSERLCSRNPAPELRPMPRMASNSLTAI
jgi:hypothetical protein